MAEQIQFELVSPERLLLSKAATMVTLPGEAGEFGVLAGHAPIIVSIGCGIVNVYEKSETEIGERFFVAGGFAEVNGESCTLLAEEAVLLSQLKQDEVAQQVRDLTEDLAHAKEEDQADITAALTVASAKLQAITKN